MSSRTRTVYLSKKSANYECDNSYELRRPETIAADKTTLASLTLAVPERQSTPRSKIPVHGAPAAFDFFNCSELLLLAFTFAATIVPWFAATRVGSRAARLW